MEGQGYTSHQDILEVATVPAPLEVAERLGLEEGQDVVMRRLRFLVNDIPRSSFGSITSRGLQPEASWNDPSLSRTASTPSCGA
jgi:hypothetical protein